MKRLVAVCMMLGILASLIGCMQKSLPELDLETSCADVSGTVPWTYCLSQTVGSDPSNVVYFFHEGGTDESIWSANNNLGRAIRDEWRQMPEVQPPVVVSISFGENWFATPGNPKVGANGFRFGLKSVLLSDVIPHVETNILNQSVVSRHLLGLSMGSYNAAQLAFQDRYEFSSVSLLCPALAIPVRQDGETNANMAQRLQADLKYLEQMLEIADSVLENGESAERYSILAYAETSTPNSMSFYISSGREDEFGFFGPALELHRLLKSNPAVHSTFVPLDGGHCNFDPSSLARFILSH